MEPLRDGEFDTAFKGIVGSIGIPPCFRKAAYPNVTTVSGSLTIRREWQYRHACGLIALKPTSKQAWRTRVVE